MAYLNTCKYCGQTVVNAAWHPECRIEYLEDLILRIQKVLKNNPTIHPKLQSEILAEKVVGFKEFEKRRKNKEDRKQKKELWEMTRHDHLQKCAEEFEKKHPDPDPIVYG